MDEQADGLIDCLRNGWLDEQTDGLIDCLRNRWMNRLMD